MISIAPRRYHLRYHAAIARVIYLARANRHENKTDRIKCNKKSTMRIELPMIDSLQMALNSNAMMLQIGPVEQGEEEAGQETSISGSGASRSSLFTSSSSPATGTTGDRLRLRLQPQTTEYEE